MSINSSITNPDDIFIHFSNGIESFKIIIYNEEGHESDVPIFSIETLFKKP